MKKYIYLLVCLTLLGTVSNSCTDSFMETNRDPNKLYSGDLPAEMVFPGVVYKTLNCMAALNYRYFAWQSRYITSVFNVRDQDDTGDNFYNFYKNALKDLKLLEDNYVGVEGYTNTANIILVWKAYIYSVMASTWGSVAMDDAIRETPDGQYRYNTEIEVNRAVLQWLGNAVSTFDPEGDKLSADPFYPSTDGSSDIEKWRKFANTLRLDVAMRMMNMQSIDPNAYREGQKHIEAALNSVNKNYLISSVEDIAKGRWGTDVNADASYYYRTILKGFEDHTTSGYGLYPSLDQYTYLYLKSFNDPRLLKYAQPARKEADKDYRVKITDNLIVNGKVCSVTYRIPYLVKQLTGGNPFGHVSQQWEGATEEQRNPYSNLNPDDGKSYAYINRDFLKSDATFPILNWADACFMLAEVQLRKDEWGVNVALDKAARDYYYDGVRASMEEYGVEASAREEYLEQNGIKWGTDSKDERGKHLGLCEYHGYFRAFIYGKEGQANCTQRPTTLPVPAIEYSINPTPEKYVGNYEGRAAITGGLEQVWKQRFLADFWNGHAATVLEHRTRIMNFPPIFFNNIDNEGSYGRVGYYQCDYAPERQTYPLWELTYNPTCYAEACRQVQQYSQLPNSARSGDNYYTPLAMSAKYYGIDNAHKDALKVWESFQMFYHDDILYRFYGTEVNDEFYRNVRRYYPQCPSTINGLKEYIDFEIQEK